MALLTDQPSNAKVDDCVQQENTTKAKLIRKKYSAKKTEFHVRKRTVRKSATQETICDTFTEANTHQYNLTSSVRSLAMIYPPCPQYYPMTNEWSPLISIPSPLYSLQSIPVIVNSPLISTQICPYPSVAIPTVTNPVSPIAPVNEFTLSPIVASVPNMSAAYYEGSPLIANLSSVFSNLALCNDISLATSLNSYSSLVTPLSNEVTPSEIPLLNEFSPIFPHMIASYDSPLITMPTTDFFSPNQNIQGVNEIVLFNNVDNEISPLSNCSYESLPYEYFESNLPTVDENIPTAETVLKDFKENPLEFYLSLPRDLFPTARMMTVDKNAIIDEFCRVSNLDDHSWILDLEFGVPKNPVTRRVATYNVKLNSIHCKNAPEAIHPGFERCDQELKRMLMLYYDCIISNWYTGYIALSNDRSVENFQSWLRLPMQVLGMCWP